MLRKQASWNFVRSNGRIKSYEPLEPILGVVRTDASGVDLQF